MKNVERGEKRGKNAALLGCAVQAAVTIVLAVLWRVTGSQAALTGLWLLAGGLAVWLMTALLFYARQLAQQESMEISEFARRGAEGGAIFDEGAAGELRPARRRVAFLEKWIIPIFTLLLAAYHVALPLLMLRRLRDAEPAALSHSGAATIFLVLGAFGAFLLSRYATGMSRLAEWRPLRAAGSCLLMSAVFLAAVAVALLLDSQGIPEFDPLLAWFLPLVQLVLAGELVLNFVLDLYRPRVGLEEYRPAYDSRLFNLLAEPGRVGHSIADTLNYQFGFEVSKTWFYQLVSKAVLPLLIFGAVVLLAMSSLVIVPEGQEGFVKRFGCLRTDAETLRPGLHVKWPWPIENVERFPTGGVQEILLGVSEKENSEKIEKTRAGRTLFLWAEAHGPEGRKERDFLIGAPPKAAARTEAKNDYPVRIIKLAVVVRYRIRSPYNYAYTAADPRRLIERVARREMVQYCAQATLDTVVPGEADRPQAIMTTGRQAAAGRLRERIQDRLGPEGVDLGVEIVHVGILSAHPPPEAIPQYEGVLEAERLRDKQRYDAEARARRILAEAAGDAPRAMRLFLALHKAEVFQQLADLQARADETFAAVLAEKIALAEGRTRTMEGEIRREQLLGRKESDLMMRVELRDGYRTFREQLERIADSPDRQVLQASAAEALVAADAILAGLAGTSATLLADARADKWRKQLRETLALEAYRRVRIPYQAAPRVWRFDRTMDVLDEILPGMRKYVVGVDKDRIELRINLEETQSPLDVLGTGEEEKQN